MLKKLFVLTVISVLTLNCAEQFPINQDPYIIFRDPGTNSYMQDRSCIHVKDDHAFFGIFDGHGNANEGHLIADVQVHLQVTISQPQVLISFTISTLPGQR